jgi:hypothetical protein
MTVSTINILENLKKEDKEKVSYFITLLLKQSNYQNSKKELSTRREEIKNKETLTHKDIWKNLNV